MKNLAVSIYNASIENVGGNYNITAYLVLEENGKQLGIDRVRMNSKESKELKECMNRLLKILADKN